MISATTSQMLLEHIFVDQGSPYATFGFEISLHTDANSGGDTEISAHSYARAMVGHGPSYWSVGSRQCVNVMEIVFPETGADEVWPSIRSMGIWSGDGARFLWSVNFDIGSYTVGSGDRLVVPPNGLAVGIG